MRQYNAVSLDTRAIKFVVVAFILVALAYMLVIGILAIIERDNSYGVSGAILPLPAIILAISNSSILIACTPEVLIFDGKVCKVSDCTITKVKTTTKGKKIVHLKCGSFEGTPRMTKADFDTLLSVTGLPLPASASK